MAGLSAIAARAPLGADLPGQPHRRRGRLDVEGDRAAARVDVLDRVPSGSSIIRCASRGTSVRRVERLDHRRPEGQVGHEVVVHHVDVDPVGAADPRDLVTQRREVGVEDARRDLDAHGTSLGTEGPVGRDLGRAAALGSAAGGEVAGAAPPGAGLACLAAFDAAGDPRLRPACPAAPRAASASSPVRPLVACCTTASRAARASPARRRPAGVSRTSTRRRSAPVRRSASPARSSWLTRRTAPEWVSPSDVGEPAHVGIAEELLEGEQRGGRAPGQPGGPLESRLALLGEVQRQGGQQVLQPGVYRRGHLVIV